MDRELLERAELRARRTRALLRRLVDRVASGDVVVDGGVSPPALGTVGNGAKHAGAQPDDQRGVDLETRDDTVSASTAPASSTVESDVVAGGVAGEATSDEVLRQIDLLDLIPDLDRRRGRAHEGCIARCPLHGAKGRIVVWERRQIYACDCLGGVRAGNAIDFVMTRDGVTHGLAVERLRAWIADRASG